MAVAEMFVDFSCMPLEAIFFGAGNAQPSSTAIWLCFLGAPGVDISQLKARYVKNSQVILSFYLGS